MMALLDQIFRANQRDGFSEQPLFESGGHVPFSF
uniref:Uncharacterized protein n=1 Tax=Arundo donax TaxID=35708 RepID=A0A0A9GS82_ARUDO